MVTAFNRAWQVSNADIISCSWGGGTSIALLDTEISNALTQGRGTQGCIVVFCSHNDNSSIRYPADSNPDILTVGANTNTGSRASFSNYGSQLDVVAPGVNIYTADIQGSAGYNTSNGTNGNHYASFGGTSAACPHVAGVAALILSVRPDLTGQQVRNVIEQTAQKVGGYPYSTQSGRSNGIWHEQMGYGLVDAHAAVRTAIMHSVTISGPTTICSQPTYTYTIANLPQGATVQWSASNNSMTLNAPSNSATAIFRQTGFTNCEIRAAISFNGTVIANVALPVTICQPAISGPSTVCEQGTFTIDNLPQGATVQWSASNNNLTLISGQGTGTAVFQKAIYMTGGTLCTVKAKITFTSAGVNQTFSKEVTVSGPDPSKISISLFGANNSALCLNYPNDLVAGYNNTDSPEYDNIQEYEWHISDGWVLAYNHPANMDGIYPTNFIARARSISGNSSSPVYVSVRARNNCGWGPWSISTAFSTTNCSGSGYFSISPNPAPAGLVTINIQNETKTARNATSQSKTPYTIQLWNSLGIVKQIVTDQKSYQMDLSGVPAGFYYVHVIKDGKTYRKQLIVK